MTLGTEAVRQLLAELASPDHDARARAADSVVDWINSYSADEGAEVGRTLIALAHRESDPRALEALLHALAELAESDLLGPGDILVAARVSRNGDPSVDEYLDYLTELASPPSQR